VTGFDYALTAPDTLSSGPTTFRFVDKFTHVAFASKKHTVVVVLTHGDDKLAIAPLLAKYSSEGHAVYFAVFTGLQDPAGDPGTPGREQLMCSSRALGVKETFVTRARAGDVNATAYERLATTLGGTVSLRLVMPASGDRETDIFKGL